MISTDRRGVAGPHWSGREKNCDPATREPMLTLKYYTLLLFARHICTSQTSDVSISDAKKYCSLIISPAREKRKHFYKFLLQIFLRSNCVIYFLQYRKRISSCSFVLPYFVLCESIFKNITKFHYSFCQIKLLPN